MSKKWDWLPVHETSLRTLFEDVGKNSFRSFSATELPPGIISKGLEYKVSQYAVVCSGSANGQGDWMALIPYRVDRACPDSPYAYEHDKDPIIFCFDSNGGPYASGIATYHANYEGRTEPIPSVDFMPYEEAVATIRNTYVPLSGALGQTPQDLVEAIGYGASLFERKLREHSE